MKKASRSELIRAIYKAKAGGFAYVPSGKPPKPKETVTGKINSQSFGLALSFRWGRTEWLETPDEKPNPATPRPKRDSGETAITKIARKAGPKKLARLVATAEDLLAERALQSRP
jgi:hypothetical protein